MATDQGSRLPSLDIKGSKSAVLIHTDVIQKSNWGFPARDVRRGVHGHAFQPSVSFWKEHVSKIYQGTRDSGHNLLLPARLKKRQSLQSRGAEGEGTPEPPTRGFSRGFPQMLSKKEFRAVSGGPDFSPRAL